MLSKRMRVSSVEKDRSVERRVSSRVPKERQRFTPWLEEQINRGNIDGLEWIEKDKGLFKVPWVRVDKPEFVLETHAELFKRWAQHTGKYRQGDQPDPSTWKTRFRCALRKMQEIVEIKELGSLEGSKPYRAFRFKPKLKGIVRNNCYDFETCMLALTDNTSLSLLVCIQMLYLQKIPLMTMCS